MTVLSFQLKVATLFALTVERMFPVPSLGIISIKLGNQRGEGEFTSTLLD